MFYCNCIKWLDEWTLDTALVQWDHRLSFSRRLLAWDSYEAHLIDDKKKLLKFSKTETVTVAGGTKIVAEIIMEQALNKHNTRAIWWMLANEKYEYTAASNMKPILRRLTEECFLISWGEISNGTIANSTKSCGLH